MVPSVWPRTRRSNTGLAKMTKAERAGALYRREEHKMKKIINGRVYNTATAHRLAQGGNGLPRNDFSYCEEELYRTKSGKYFLYGKGGPNSRHARRVEQNTWTGAEAIIPISTDTARDWAEEHLSADDYSDIFAVIPDGADRETLNLTVSPATKSALLRMREEQGLSISRIIDEMVNKSI